MGVSISKHAFSMKLATKVRVSFIRTFRKVAKLIPNGDEAVIGHPRGQGIVQVEYRYNASAVDDDRRISSYLGKQTNLDLISLDPFNSDLSTRKKWDAINLRYVSKGDAYKLRRITS